jgi:hypothetical protein
VPVFDDYKPVERPEPVNSNPATPNQGQFLKRLVEERELSQALLVQVEVGRAAWVEGTMTKQHASGLIDLLKAAPYKRKTETSLEPGIYFKAGRYFKVVPNQEGTSVYAKVWQDNEWFFTRGLIREYSLTSADKVTAEQAAEFGKVTGACVFCSRLLTDERSLEVGYGPVCADKNGLPWGGAGIDPAVVTEQTCCDGTGWTGDPSMRCVEHYEPYDGPR